jgi:foldase protein PrsA
MAARKTTKKKEVKKPKAKVSSVSESVETKKSRLSGRNKIIIGAFILAAAYVVFFAKGVFIAATVNGRPVSRLSVIRELEKQGGAQTLESLVNEALIKQEAQKAGINPSKEELDGKVAEFTEQVTAQGQDIDSLLEAQGMTQEDFREQISIQLTLEKLLSERIEVTDEEVNGFIETNSEYLPQDLSEEEVNKLAREELFQQKLSGEFSTWLAEVTQASDINYFVEY